jgi:hypothetical protein
MLPSGTHRIGIELQEIATLEMDFALLGGLEP